MTFDISKLRQTARFISLRINASWIAKCGDHISTGKRKAVNEDTTMSGEADSEYCTMYNEETKYIYSVKLS